MPRVSIELPERFGFRTEVPIYVQHINYGQHLDNAALLALLNEVRARYFRALGFADERVDGLAHVIADSAVQYRAEAFYGDTLVFELAATDFNKYGCDLLFRAASKLHGGEIARGKLGIVFVDSAQRRPAPLPALFRERAGQSALP